MGLCDVGERNPLVDPESRPSASEHGVDAFSGSRFRGLGKVVAAEKEDPDILEDQRPEWDCRRGRLRRVGSNRTVIRQNFAVHLDVCAEGHFHYVIHPARGKSAQISNELIAGTPAVLDNLVRAGRTSQRGVGTGTHGSEYPSACEPRQTDRADTHCTGATLD